MAAGPLMLVFMVEEPSMKVVLEHLVPQVIPQSVPFLIIPHQGKQDLQKSLPKKLRGWNAPARFVIVHDQDSHDCRTLKKSLQNICAEAGKPDSLVRIVCHELESWFLGDLRAVGRAFGKPSLAERQAKKPYRQPDELNNAKQKLRQLVSYQPIGGSRKIAPYLSLEDNRSHSFQVFLEGLRRVVREIST